MAKTLAGLALLAASRRSRQLPPLHPGEVLREEFLIPLGMSAGALARACGVPRTRIERIAKEQTNVTAETALLLAKALRTSPELWLNLQNDFDVRSAKRQIGRKLEKIQPVNTAATGALPPYITASRSE